MAEGAAVPESAAELLHAFRVALSPGILLLIFPDPLHRFELPSLVIRPAEGVVAPPLAWQRLATAHGSSLVLIARAQPDLETGAHLTLEGAFETRRYRISPSTPLTELVEGLGPVEVLNLLRFIASKATGTLRHSDDAGLANACHAAAQAVIAPDRSAIAVAACGPDMVLWSLPAPVQGRNTVCYVLGERRLRRAVVQGDTVILRDRQFEDGFLLVPNAEAPVHLAPAGGRLPSLAELGRSKEPESRGFYRRGLAELARRAPVDPNARKLLRDLQILTPTAKPHRILQPGRPFGAALELGLCDHGGGAFFRGWLRDPLEIISGLTLRSDHGDVPLDPGRLGRFSRPDLAQSFADSPFGGLGPKAGFVAHLPAIALRPVAQWSLRVEFSTGDSAMLVAPPAILHPQGARDAVLNAVPGPEVTPALLADCIAPAVRPLHAAVLAQRKTPDLIQIGRVVGSPALSIVVPLYRNLRFLRHQYAALARDPVVRAASELIYVLDSPEQSAEVEHQLRGLEGLYGFPVTLVVQSGNFGYASACNAGADHAAGDVLLMLNSDVVPADRSWLQPLLCALDADRALLAVGPKLLFEDGSLQHAGLFFERGPHGEWFNNHYYKGFPRYYAAAQKFRRVPGITGAALCVRRDAFRDVSGFTTDYVIGDYEDSDLCLKLRATGGHIAYVPQSELYHFERQSIRNHDGYARSLAAAFNRQLHNSRWSSTIEHLMGEMTPGRSIASD